MANQFHRGSYIVYLNGIEVPCPSVTVSYGVWQMPEVQLAFPPHRLLERLGAEDRLEVAVFYLDDLYDPEKPKFRVLFEGEILGWNYANSPFGRQMVFTAIADISVFSQIFFFFMNTVESVLQYHTTPQQGTAPPPGNIFYPQSLFYKGLVTNDPSASPTVSTPFEILYNVVKGMISSKVTPSKRSLPAVNFYSRWIRKRNFQNRFVALPLFEDPGDDTKGIFPIFKAVQCDVAADALREQLAPTVGESGSIWDGLRQVFDRAYCEIVMLPTPPAHRVRLEDGVILAPREPGETIIAEEPIRLANYFCKPQMLFGIAPACNVFFPSMVRNLNHRENYWQQPSRVYVNDSFIPKVLQENYFTAAALRVGYPPEVNAAVQQAIGPTVAGDTKTSINARALYNAKNLLVFPEEFFKGPVLSRMQVPSWFTLLMKQSKARRAAVDGKTPPADVLANNKELDSIQNLFQLYAEYEYYRQRYEKRSGAVELVWNPYVVPGFPCVSFDNREGSLDTMGYVTTVTHNLSSTKGGGQMSTTVQYSYGRTLWEVLENIHYASKDLGVVLGSAPPDPVEPVRAISQDFEQAEQFYRTLFFGRDANLTGKKASFDFREVVGFVKNQDAYGNITEVGEFKVDGPTAREKSQTVTGSSPALANLVAHNNRPVTSNILDAKNSDLVPLEGFKQIFHDYDEAMRYIARPICSLEEYIEFMHQGVPLPALVNQSVVSGPQYAYAATAGPAAGKEPSAVYYSRIRKLRFDPTKLVQPDPAATGIAPDGQPVPGVLNAVPVDFPQTRDDWDARLLAYREQMYAVESPQR